MTTGHLLLQGVLRNQEINTDQLKNNMKKDKLRSFTIITSFILGWGLTIAGFITPPLGVIDNSVLVIMGQVLTYCAVGVGLKDYVDSRIHKYDEENHHE